MTDTDIIVKIDQDKAAYYKSQGKTLIDVLDELFEKYGFYNNKTVSFAFEGASGMEKMASPGS